MIEVIPVESENARIAAPSETCEFLRDPGDEVGASLPWLLAHVNLRYPVLETIADSKESYVTLMGLGDRVSDKVNKYNKRSIKTIFQLYDMLADHPDSDSQSDP